VRKRHGPALVGPGVAATRADDEDSEAGNGVRNGSLRSRPPPAGWIAAALIDPHFLQGRSHSARLISQQTLPLSFHTCSALCTAA
jgi:hypothetical protein